MFKEKRNITFLILIGVRFHTRGHIFFQIMSTGKVSFSSRLIDSNHHHYCATILHIANKSQKTRLVILSVLPLLCEEETEKRGKIACTNKTHGLAVTTSKVPISDHEWPSATLSALMFFSLRQCCCFFYLGLALCVAI